MFASTSKPAGFSRLVREQQPQKLEPIGKGKSGAELATFENGQKAVVKYVKPKMPSGKATQRHFPVKSLPLREAAFYRLAQLLGFTDIVPETVLAEDKQGRTFSAQRFVPAMQLHDVDNRLYDHDREDWWKLLKQVCDVVPREQWRKLFVLDLIAGARDRHATNVGVRFSVDDAGGKSYNLVAWDNACTFGLTFAEYRSVFHRALFANGINLDAHWDMLEGLRLVDFYDALEGYVTDLEIFHAWKRAQFMLAYPYKLPWKILSKGHDHHTEFPTYSDFFEEVVPAELLAE